MLKIIDGKRYNTETAEQVLFHNNGKYQNDFGYRSTTLFRTNNGAWFIRHYGGPFTDMATSAGNGLGWGEELEPVSDDAAFKFLQSHSDYPEAQEAIEKYFANCVQDA